MQPRISGVAVVLGLLIASGSAAADEVITANFNTPGVHSWLVPAGVTSVQVTAVGGHGADGVGEEATAGRPGQRVSSAVAIPPGTAALTVRVVSGAPGGVGGGPAESHGGSGGTATEVVAGTTRLVVAAGGGGGGGGCLFIWGFSIDNCGNPAGSGDDGAGGAPAGVNGGDGFLVPFTVAGGGGGGGGGGYTGGAGGNGGSAFAFPLPVPGLLDLTSHPGGQGGSGASHPVAGVETEEAPRVVISYVRGSTVLGYTGATSGDYHDPATVSARLTLAGGTPVAGAAISFVLNAAESCSGTTDAAGDASCVITPQEPAGSYPLVASYAGDAVKLPSSVTVNFTVTKQETTLAYIGDTTVANGESARLAADLREENGSAIQGRDLTLVLGEGSAAQTCSATTDASGVGACTIAAVNQPLNGAATVALAATFAGDAFYIDSAASATASLQFMTADAYAIAGRSRLLTAPIVIAPTPANVTVRTAEASDTDTPCTVTGPLGARTLCASATTTIAPGGSSAAASVERARIAIGGLLPVIDVSAIDVYSVSSCDGAEGGTTVGELRIAGVPVRLDASRPSTITLPLGGRILINEQLPAGQGLTVNGVHIIVPPVLGLAEVDLVLGHATSAMHNCRPGDGGD